MACERRDGDSRASDRIWRTSRSNHADHDDVYVDDYDDDYDDEEGAATAARWVSAVVLLYSVGFVVCARHYSPRLASPRLDLLSTLLKIEQKRREENRIVRDATEEIFRRGFCSAAHRFCCFNEIVRRGRSHLRQSLRHAALQYLLGF